MNDRLKYNTLVGTTITVITDSDGEIKAIELRGAKYYREEDGYLGFVLVPYDSFVSVKMSELPSDIVFQPERPGEPQQFWESLEVAIEKKAADDVLVSFSTGDELVIWNSNSYLMFFAQLLKIRLDKYKEKHPEIEYSLDTQLGLSLYVSFHCRGETVSDILKAVESDLREILLPLQSIDDIVKDEFEGGKYVELEP